MKPSERQFGNVLLPLSTESFTYEIATPMQPPRIGDWVQVPLRKSVATGVYTGKAKEVSPEIQSLARPVEACQSADELPFLPESLLRLIDWTASYYICPEGAVLKYAIPSGVWKGLFKVPRRSRLTETGPLPSDKPEGRFQLSAEQERALQRISSETGGVFLLKGVTGSGKTEVYLRAVESLPEGLGTIVLVPEIVLTTQMVRRFQERFGEKVVIYHSGLSEGQRTRAWNEVRQGRARVAIGVRSAIFLPFEKLGMVIVDEEHSATYKQAEGLRYNARDLSVVRGKLQGATIILGSATPSLESYENARSGKYQELVLSQRVKEKPMPLVKVVDMKAAAKASPSVSEELREAVSETLTADGQVLLLITRRGFAHVVMCGDCGQVAKCPLCSVSLTHHKKVQRLRCHHCGSELMVPVSCSHCGGTRLLFQGEGTERAEEEVRELFPGLAPLRMDYDTTRRRNSFAEMIASMETGETSMLVGTQMVAKGHDFPGVHLAAVVSGDVLLGLPDFRAAERAFQLFSQLSGRAGRGEVPGRVLIQTHDPEHFIFEYVARHDYDGFASRELDLRRSLGYPPYSRIIRFVVKGKVLKNFEKTLETVDRVCRNFRPPGVELLGPAPCPLSRLRGYHRWHLLLRGKSSSRVHAAARGLAEKLRALPALALDIDVDPVHML